MSETILINSLPTRTWNRLGVNETALTWGESADLGTEHITAAGQTVRLDIAGSGEYSEQTVDIQAPAGQPVTVFETLRAEVVDLDRDAATIYMVESNLQRTTILPSEKAFSYKMRLEAMKRQGRRSDLTSTPVVSKLRSDEEIGKDVGESREQIRRYIRLTELVPPLLDMVDAGKMALRPAVEISYLPEVLQFSLYRYIEQEECTPSHAQAVRMRKLLDKNKLTAESIYAILIEEKPNQKQKLVLREERISGLIPSGIPMGKREDYIIKALTYYAKYRERNRENEKNSR